MWRKSLNLFDGEYKFFDEKDGVPYFSTQEFHQDREAAPHIDQYGMQRDRLVAVADLVNDYVDMFGIKSVADICCGDGGLLEYLQPFFKSRKIQSWGYDFQPANVHDAVTKRKVDVRFADVINDDIEYAEMCIMTECLEHFYHPHEYIKKLADNNVKILIASSPNGEVPEAHYEFHTWGWSEDAYRNLFEQAGYHVIDQTTSTIFQIQVGILQ